MWCGEKMPGENNRKKTKNKIRDSTWISQSQPASDVTSAWFNDSFVIRDQQPLSAAAPPLPHIQHPLGSKRNR